MRRPCHLALSLFGFGVLITALGCGSPQNADQKSGTTAEGKATPAPIAAAVKAAEAAPEPVVKKKPSVRLTREPWRPLLHEADRAELDVGGIVVDLGAGDQRKYTLGGWKNGWGKPKTDESGLSYASVKSRKVPLRVLVRGTKATEAVLRIRGRGKGQFIGVMVGGKERGNAAVPQKWSTVRVPLRRGAIEPGWQVVDLIFRTKGAKGVRADIDWVWLKSSDGEDPLLGPRVLPISVGGKTRRALTAPTPRTYSFYLHVPEKGSLVFDYGSAEPATFNVRAETADGVVHELFKGASEGGTWTEADIDLGAVAGKAVRLDLQTSGGAGVVGWGEPEIMVPQRAAEEAAAPAKPAKNVVLVLIDTARFDAYKAYNPASLVRTPSYDALVADSTLFENAYNNENWTKPSVATVLSGLYPITHGAKTDKNMLPNEVELLSERLRKNGFATGAFIANGYCGKEFGFGQGWDFYRNYIRENRKNEAEFVYRDTLAWIDKVQAKNKDKRFFTYIQTIDPHVTYKVDRSYSEIYHPKPYKGRVGPTLDGFEQADYSKGKKKLKPGDYDWIKALYYGEIHYHDDQMGLFIKALKERDLFENTLFIVTNDHGEELNDHGRLGHGHSLYEHMIRAPLMMRYPGVFNAGVRVPEVVEHVDLFPTVLEVLDLPASKHVDGQSLLPLVRSEPVARPKYAVTEFVDNRFAVRVGNWKMMMSSGDWGGLYHLKTDPSETKDNTKKRPIARKLCEVYLSEALASPSKANRRKLSSQQRRFKGADAKMDPELKRQLEALGYFGE